MDGWMDDRVERKESIVQSFFISLGAYRLEKKRKEIPSDQSTYILDNDIA